jgi:hypothetical protein
MGTGNDRRAVGASHRSSSCVLRRSTINTHAAVGASARVRSICLNVSQNPLLSGSGPWKVQAPARLRPRNWQLTSRAYNERVHISRVPPDRGAEVMWAAYYTKTLVSPSCQGPRSHLGRSGRREPRPRSPPRLRARRNHATLTYNIAGTGPKNSLTPNC